MKNWTERHKLISAQ